MNKAYKYRIYPNKQQTVLLLKTFGCCRFVYNKALHWRNLAYNADKTSLSYSDTSYGLTALKHQNLWLKEVDSIALQQALRHLDTAFKNFFTVQGSKYPKYKSKHHSRKSYTTINQHGTVAVYDTHVKLPKLGLIKASVSRMAPEGWIIKSATVSQESDGKFYISVLYEYKDQIIPQSIDINNAIGLDYKSDGLYVASDGAVCGSPKYYRKSHKRLAKEQRKLSRKKGSRKGETKSSNFKKQQLKINRIHRHISNQRLDFLHKRSTEIANRYDIVCVETLNMRSMSNKGFGNGKATLDNGYGMFLNMLEYKLSDRGKYLIKVDKWYPSSQICHNCGYKNPVVKDLNVRTVICPCCGATYDRDENSSLNTRDEGLRLFKLQSTA